jgi:hypothetical protein
MPKEIVEKEEIFALAKDLHFLRVELSSLNSDLLSKKQALLDLWPDSQGDKFRAIIDAISSLNIEADGELENHLRKLKKYYDNLDQAGKLG